MYAFISFIFSSIYKYIEFLVLIIIIYTLYFVSTLNEPVSGIVVILGNNRTQN